MRQKAASARNLVQVPDPAAGVVRGAEDDHALAAGEGGGEAIEVHRVAAVRAEDEGRLDDLAGVGAQDAVEGVVDGREQDHPVAGGGEGLQADGQPGDDAVGGEDRGGVDAPVVAAGHPAADRRPVAAVVAEVAEDAVRRLGLHRRRNLGRGAEVHVGHPHGEPVVRRDAVERLHHVPLAAMRAAAVDDLVEVEHGRSLPAWAGQELLCRERGRKPLRRLVKAGGIAYLAAMAIRPILIHPDPRLRKPAAPVEAVDDELRALAADMLATMYDAPGIGLAATQLGVMRQLFVMDCGGKDDPPQPMVLLNPEILWTSEETVTSEEGCLSIPDVYEDVTRPERVRLRWLGLDGEMHEAEFGERWAICAQHEMDHLRGRLFIDHLSVVKRTMITSRMKKLKREKARA